MMRRLIQRLRSLGIDWTCSAMTWNDRLLADHGPEISKRDHTRWFIEGALHRLFGMFWNGSDEEIDSALNGEVPRRYMTDRQRAALREKIAHFEAPTIGALQIGNGVPIRLIDDRLTRDTTVWCNPIYTLFEEFFCADCDAELLVADEANLCAECRALHPELLLMDRAA